MMWKLLIVVGVGFVLYMHGYDKGLPERQHLAQLERRIAVLEAHARASAPQKPVVNPAAAESR